MADGRDLAGVLLRKARGDLATVEAVCDNPSVPDETIGFHAQQAVEKSLKAVLAIRAVEYPFTHDVRLLVELAEQSGLEVPAEVGAGRELRAWAAELRYEDPQTLPPLDRARALELAAAAVAWARQQVGDG